MQLHEFQYLSKEEKEKINVFIINNIEIIYDIRESYGANIDTKKQILEIAINKDIKNEFVDKKFVGYFCNVCNDWVEGTSDISLVEHVLEHLNTNIEGEINVEIQLKREILNLLFDKYVDWDLDAIDADDRDEYVKENEKNKQLRIDIISEILQEL